MAEAEHPADSSLPEDDSRTAGRWMARLSAISAFVCFTMNCVLNQLLFKDRLPAGDIWNQVVGSLSVLVVVAGVALGIGGLMAGIRRKSLDTVGIAIIGLLLNLGILAVTAWALYVLRK